LRKRVPRGVFQESERGVLGVHLPPLRAKEEEVKAHLEKNGKIPGKKAGSDSGETSVNWGGGGGTYKKGALGAPGALYWQKKRRTLDETTFF